MWPLLRHVYEHAEMYTVCLAWVTLPLGFYAMFDFSRRHYGMFRPVSRRADSPEEKGHGTH